MKIRDIRKALNLSQANFAKLLGVHQTAVSQWETGKTFPDTDMLIRISRITGKSVNDILDVKAQADEEADNASRRTFEMVMPDDSMRGARILKNETIYFTPCVHPLKNGMIAAVETDEGVVIRYLYKCDGGYLLVAAAEGYAPRFVGNGVKILGRAYAFRGEIS